MALHDEIDLAPWIDERLAVLDPPQGWVPTEARGLVAFREGRAAKPAHRLRWTWIPVVAGTILLLVVLIPTVRGFAHACREFVQRTLSGGDATHATEAMQRGLLSDAELRDVNGRVVNLADYRGKVVLLTYWSTTCGQCQSEMAWFNEFQRTFGDERFAVVGVAVDRGGADAVSQFLVHRSINYRVVLGDREVAQLHAATSIPTTFILDKTGRIAVRHVGYCSKREFESDIRTVLAEP